MNLKLNLPKLNTPKKESTSRININLLRNHEYSNSYKQNIIEKVSKETALEETCEQTWLNTVNTCLEAGRETLGEMSKNNKPPENKEIKILTERKMNLFNNMKGCNSQAARTKMNQEIKSIKKKISAKLKSIEEDEIDSKLQSLEQIRDDNTKYYYALRNLQNSKTNKKATIIVKDKEGNCPSSTQVKIKIIQEYFKETLAP